MLPETLGKRITSCNTRSSEYRNTVNTVAKSDTFCPICGGAARRGGKYCGTPCYRIAQRSSDTEARFWSKVDRRGDGCWLWTAGIFGSLGYGSFAQLVNGKWQPTYAHRVAWELTNGPIPNNQHVLHVCDVPRCCQPDHLFLGNQKANMADCASKGRLHVSRPNAHKVSTEQLAEVDALLAAGVRKSEIARRFGVSKTWVSLYASGARRFDRKAS